MILVDYTGLNVEQMTALRTRLRQAGSSMQVIRNSFLSLEAKKRGLEGLGQMVKGPTALITGVGDVTVVAKVIRSFAGEHNKLAVEGGLLGAKVLSVEDIDALAKIPSREVLLGQVLGTMAAPMSQLVGVLNAKLCSVLYVLKAVETQKSGQK
jgi:large subunit ribosomal protein L10